MCAEISCFVFTSVMLVFLQFFKGRDLIDLTKSFIIQGLYNRTLGIHKRFIFWNILLYNQRGKRKILTYNTQSGISFILTTYFYLIKVAMAKETTITYIVAGIPRMYLSLIFPQDTFFLSPSHYDGWLTNRNTKSDNSIVSCSFYPSMNKKQNQILCHGIILCCKTCCINKRNNYVYNFSSAIS
jgi:hypothetical protein